MTQEVYRYCLSENDLDIIKHYTDKPLSENARKTLIILSEVFGGLHHLEQNQLKYFDWQSQYYNEYLVGNSLSTFDGMDLTTLVIIAHSGSWNFICWNGYKTYNSDFHKTNPQSVDDVVPCDATNDFTVWKEHPIDCMQFAVEMNDKGEKKYFVNGKWVNLKC